MGLVERHPDDKIKGGVVANVTTTLSRARSWPTPDGARDTIDYVENAVTQLSHPAGHGSARSETRASSETTVGMSAADGEKMVGV